MLHPALRSAPAAALLAAALVILAAACGGDSGDTGTPTPPGSPGATEQAAPVRRVTIDLGSGGAPTMYTGQDPADLVNVSSSLALGDFNDDGDPDALIGAPQADGPGDSREDAGEAYVILGPLDKGRGLGGGEADVTIFGAAEGDGLGFTVASGDINDDGVDDVLVGAPGVTAGFDPRSDQGRVYVFFGGKDFGDDPERDLSQDVFDFTVTGAEGFSRLGHAMDTGDVNGDGAQDLVVGAPFAGRKPGTPPGGERTALGEVYVIYGGDGLSGEKNIARDEFDALLSGEVAFGQFGASVGVGDVNGDGREDIVAGAYRASADAQATGSGFAYVFYGGSEMRGRRSVQDGDQDVTITGPTASSLGFPLAVGDFNGDKVEDMALGAQLESSGLLNRQGAVHIILGSSDLADTIDAAEATDITITGSISAELFPSALAAADVDGDGAADLIAGSALASAGDDRPGGGMVHIFTKMAAVPETIDLETDTASASVLGAAADDRLGGAVTGGEVLDGARGILALAAMADAGNRNDVGAVYVIPVGQ